MKTFLKDEQIQQGTLKKSLKIIRRKLIISNSNKMQPLLNDSK